MMGQCSLHYYSHDGTSWGQWRIGNWGFTGGGGGGGGGCFYLNKRFQKKTLGHKLGSRVLGVALWFFPSFLLERVR